MFELPQQIVDCIEELTQSRSLKSAYADLSARYRMGTDKSLQGINEHLAYLACRMPATYAANCEVFRRLKEILPHFQPQTVLDVGSGPGTSLLALSEFFAIKSANCVEPDRDFVELAKKFLVAYPFACSWQVEPDATFDLVISSYMFSELERDQVDQMCGDLLQQTAGLIVLIDTGTPKGYATLMQARTFIIEHGYQILAPCPHNKPCPIQAPDWCHFSVRLPRNERHRQVKGADRGFEDEKFCYLIASKAPLLQTTVSRIVGAPMKRSGHVHLKLCTTDGQIAQSIISKKMKERYQCAKKAEWGDSL